MGPIPRPYSGYSIPNPSLLLIQAFLYKELFPFFRPRNDRTSLISYCKTALIKAAWIESPVACKICGVEMMSLSADFLLFKKDGGTVAAPCPFTALRHVMTHLENPVFDCGFCLYQCKDISAMRSHLSSRHNRKSHNDLDFTDKTNGYRNEILNLIDQCFKPTDNRTGTR